MVQQKSPVLDKVFHALAHPARREMLRHLAGGERNLSELAAPLRMSFPAASKHVRVLERAKVVRRRVVGREHLCRIEGKPLEKANVWLEGYRQFWEESFEKLDSLLAEMKAVEKTKAKRKNPKRKETQP
ncbi:ArsR/SmtB family transcription factor [Luteolibacter sp. Populi]|uniref:ArsR/SmtB family transcription factor n=1 Tax=Luteolibacter sp. Populi TaxID=3230487 RepID=UPI003467C81F